LPPSKVHSIAHAKTEDLQNDFIYTSREGFAHAMNISAYSLVAVSRGAKELMTEGGSIITLTYMGSEKVFKGYNVMGVAKAALEASVRYLAGRTCKNAVPKKAPLKRNITQEDLGKTALYLLSDLSSGVTGEVIHVDSGYNIRAFLINLFLPQIPSGINLCRKYF